MTVSWDFGRVLERDDQWGIATVRQRMPLRADNVAAVAERYRFVPGLAGLARAFAARLRERWGPAVDMPLYRPFR